MAMAMAAKAPQALRVIGRCRERENGDITGAYTLLGAERGRATYQQSDSATIIRYSPSTRRWVIDREGNRDSEVCVAYADDPNGLTHPAHASLLWHIWDSQAQAHLPDPELMLTDAPNTFFLVGRDPELENAAAVGEYVLQEMRHGRPAYRLRDGSTVIRYHAPEDRWLVSAAGETGNVCSAFAEARGTPHPAFATLEWHFWEARGRAFVPDPAVAALTSPLHVHVIGRDPRVENGGICGTYRLAGAHCGRPVYLQPGTSVVIRYAAKQGLWLIDRDSCADPSFSRRLYQWLLRGDASAAQDCCVAFAEAQSTCHPGFSQLEWKVWDSRAGRHHLDPALRVTTAPLALRVAGRNQSRENGDIGGDYMLAGTHLGRPAYQRPGSTLTIRYWPPMRRWLMDRGGMRSTDTCVAYADGAAECLEHPACPEATWHVFESSRGCHLADSSISVSIPPNTPLELPRSVPTAAQSVGTARLKRLRDAEEPSAKRAKVESAQEEKAGRRAGGMRWLAGLFGGA